ncbi:MAG: 50S ribosomal protein L25 [Acidimicrobiales bacterium]
MPEITLNAEVGRPLGSSASRRLRAAGKVPGVVYGHGTDPVPVAVEGSELRTALNGVAGTNALLELVAGKSTFLALARELQRHPVRGTVTHVDFQIVRRDEVIGADVPVTLVGEALEVAHGDGIVDQQLFALPVRAKPSDIPSAIEVDISGLTIGAAIRVADLPLPAGVATELDAEMPVVTGVAPRVQAAGTEAEGGEAEAAEGQPEEAPSGGQEG